MNILITGAAKRIGAELAVSLATPENHVLLHFNTSQKQAYAVQTQVLARGARCTLIQADLSTEVGCSQLVEAIFEVVDNLDLLINNAAEFSYDLPTAFEYEKLAHILRVNLIAPAYLMKEIGNRLPAPSTSLMVNIVDQKVKNLNPDYFSYTLAKCALAAASELYAMIFAEKGIRVISISPGVTLPSGPQTADDYISSTKATPLGRSSTPADIASAISFALLCKSITGANIVIDGGESLVRRERDIAFWDSAEAP